MEINFIDYLPNLVDEESVGLSYFTKSLELIHQRNYRKAETELKKSLKEIKEHKKEKSQVYLHVLSKLAYVNFLDQKMPQAEKYFTICRDMAKDNTDLDDKGFAFHNYLLDFYLSTNLSKAKSCLDDMIEIDFKAQNLKRIRFSLGNYHLFNKNFDEATNEYRRVLKMVPDQQLKAYILNNLNIADIKLVEREGINETRKKDFVSIFKESISLLEDLPKNRIQNPLTPLETELSEEILDLKTIIPLEYRVENENRYTGILKNRESGKILTNIAEFLLTHEKENPTNISFWFKIGLDLHENTSPESIDKFLVLLALFYSANQQISTAENLFRESLRKMEKDFSYTKAMALNMYGRMMFRDPKRKEQATL